MKAARKRYLYSILKSSLHLKLLHNFIVYITLGYNFFKGMLSFWVFYVLALRGLLFTSSWRMAVCVTGRDEFLYHEDPAMLERRLDEQAPRQSWATAFSLSPFLILKDLGEKQDRTQCSGRAAIKCLKLMFPFWNVLWRHCLEMREGT